MTNGDKDSAGYPHKDAIEKALQTEVAGLVDKMQSIAGKDYRMGVRYKVLGGRVHMRVFAGKNTEHGMLGKAGDLTLTVDEFAAWKAGRIVIEFREEGESG
jgi:hypothetical protein